MSRGRIDHFNQRRRDIDAYVDAIKREEGCLICGERNPTVLDFHHLDPAQKLLTIGTARSNAKYPIEQIIAEIAKCVIVCANHHRQVEAGEIGFSPEMIEKAGFINGYRQG